MAATLSATALAVAAAEQWRTDGVRDATLYAAMLPSGDAERHGVYAGLRSKPGGPVPPMPASCGKGANCSPF